MREEHSSLILSSSLSLSFQEDARRTRRGAMFTGSTKQRKVDFSGGKKRETERGDFLLKQARLREDRAAER